ncbi:hypothetical protein JYT71_00390 [Acidimicrobiaceae bacterium AH-315-P05]|nr:hypothetical protein [Acidimicrobiaceae bacterium AH-315-P05]
MLGSTHVATILFGAWLARRRFGVPFLGFQNCSEANRLAARWARADDSVAVSVHGQAHARAAVRTETDMTLGARRRRARALVAVEAMAGGSSVTSAAFTVGYATPSSFVAAFKLELRVPRESSRADKRAMSLIAPSQRVEYQVGGSVCSTSPETA